MFASLSPARRRLVWVMLAAAVVAMLAVATTLVVRATSGRERTGDVAQDRPGPVVLVPGYGGGTGGLSRLAQVLRAHGHPDVTVMTSVGDGTGDLDAQADRLRSTVDSVLSRTGARSVDVVGYSAGGVVARLWARDKGGARVARRIVTLGSPNHGTDLADAAGSVFGCPTACEQLQTDSELLRQLNRGDETPAGPQWVSIWSNVDQTVTPPDSARLDGAVNIVAQSVCSDSDVAHGDLPTDTVTAGLIVRALSGSAATAPARGSCDAVRALSRS